MNPDTFPADIAHEHTSHCWWHPEQAAWVCWRDGRATDEDQRPLVDVRDMVVVHTALLREFRLAPAAVTRVPGGDHRRAAVVERHLALLCDLLHHHHTSEDALLWPPLRARLPQEAVTMLDQAESQHAGIDAALARVADARRRWVEEPGISGGQLLAETLRTLHGLLAEHLDAEERTLLPLAAAHLTTAEWEAIGTAGAAAIPKTRMPLVFGMFMYEGEPDVLARMLHSAPAPVRHLVPRIAPRVYARRAARVHGTPRP